MLASPTAAGILRWVHLFSAVAWVGGLFFYLVVLLPTLKDLDPAAARRMSTLIGVRFRAVSMGALLLLLLTGFYLLVFLLQGVGNHAAFFGTPYGRVLAIKVSLALTAIATGLGIGLFLAPRLVEALEAHDEAAARAVGRKMGLLSGVSFLIGVGITVCVAVLHVNL